MKCAHPNCNRGIGLMFYRRPFGKARFCSKQCRDSYVAGVIKPARQRAATTYFEWLFLQSTENALPPMAQPADRIVQRTRYRQAKLSAVLSVISETAAETAGDA